MRTQNDLARLVLVAALGTDAPQVIKPDNLCERARWSVESGQFGVVDAEPKPLSSFS